MILNCCHPFLVVLIGFSIGAHLNSNLSHRIQHPFELLSSFPCRFNEKVLKKPFDSLEYKVLVMYSVFWPCRFACAIWISVCQGENVENVESCTTHGLSCVRVEQKNTLLAGKLKKFLDESLVINE